MAKIINPTAKHKRIIASIIESQESFPLPCGLNIGGIEPNPGIIFFLITLNSL